MTLLATIESDLAAAGGWLETEAEDVATAVWNDVGKLFQQFTAAQLTILTAAAKQVISSVEGDPLILLTPENMATEMLSYVGQREEAFLAQVTPALAASVIGSLSL